MKTAIDLPIDGMIAIAKRYGVREMALFGSVLRDDFGPDSDVDVLVDFDPQARTSLFDFVHLKLELSDLVGRQVDLVEKAGLKRFIQPEVLRTMQVVYDSV